MTAASAPEVTLITVGIGKHYGYLRRQPGLIAALNPGADFRMVMVDNGFSSAPLAIDDPRVEVLPGPASDAALPEDVRGSYHHAAALAVALKAVRSRFVAVIDPDLFVVYRRWIPEILQHMQARGLAFFGAPWHVRWFRKWRGFPCVHFLVIDLDKVDRSAIDFTPALVEDRRLSVSPFNRFLRGAWPGLYARALIETRRDTGWKLASRFSGDPQRPHETLLPISDIAEDFKKPPHVRTPWGRWLERLVPSQWRFLPKDGTYVASEDGPDLSRPDLIALAPETFVWRGAPFAMHMRHHARDFGEETADIPVDPALVEGLLDQIAAAPSWLTWTDPVARRAPAKTPAEVS